jgi:hypothetical protein
VYFLNVRLSTKAAKGDSSRILDNTLGYAGAFDNALVDAEALHKTIDDALADAEAFDNVFDTEAFGNALVDVEALDNAGHILDNDYWSFWPTLVD